MKHSCFISIIAIFFMYVVISCYANQDKYILNYELNNEIFTRKLPPDITSYYADSNLLFLLPLKQIFNEPLNLLMLHELLSEIVVILEKYNVDYWLSDMSLINYHKFANFSPWQKNIELGINYYQLLSSLDDIREILENRGIVFEWFQDLITLEKPSYLKFNRVGFYNVVKKISPSLSDQEIYKKFASFENASDPVQCWLYPYKFSSKGIVNCIYKRHNSFIQDGGSKDGYNFDDIYPLKNAVFTSISLNVPNNIANILNLNEYSRNIYQLYIGRSLIINSRSIKITDARETPQLVKLMYDFLKFTFKDLFVRFSEKYNIIIEHSQTNPNNNM